MEAFLDHYLGTNGSKSHHTRTAMIGNVKRLEKGLGKKFSEFTQLDFEDAYSINEGLKSNYANSTRLSSVLAIRAILKYLDADEKITSKYDEIMSEYVAERKEQQIDQSKTKEEKENWIDWPELQEKVSQLVPQIVKDDDMAYTVFRNFLLVSLFSLQPPTRLGNYMDMSYRTRAKMKRDATKLKTHHNYIVYEGDGKYSFVFNNYKTAKTVGQIKHVVENDLLNQVIHRWFSNYNVKRKEFLMNGSGKPMSQSATTNALLNGSKRYLNRPISLNTYRHIFLTWYLSTNPSIEDKQKILTLIGHKYEPSTAEKYARV
jgi:hypothetical protein